MIFLQRFWPQLVFQKSFLPPSFFEGVAIFFAAGFGFWATLREVAFVFSGVELFAPSVFGEDEPAVGEVFFAVAVVFLA